MCKGSTFDAVKADFKRWKRQQGFVVSMTEQKTVAGEDVGKAHLGGLEEGALYFGLISHRNDAEQKKQEVEKSVEFLTNKLPILHVGTVGNVQCFTW